MVVLTMMMIEIDQYFAIQKTEKRFDSVINIFSATMAVNVMLVLLISAIPYFS